MRDTAETQDRGHRQCGSAVLGAGVTGQRRRGDVLLKTQGGQWGEEQRASVWRRDVSAPGRRNSVSEAQGGDPTPRGGWGPHPHGESLRRGCAHFCLLPLRNVYSENTRRVRKHPQQHINTLRTARGPHGNEHATAVCGPGWRQLFLVDGRGEIHFALVELDQPASSSIVTPTTQPEQGALRPGSCASSAHTPPTDPRESHVQREERREWI